MFAYLFFFLTSELSDEDEEDDDVIVPGAELEDLDPELEAYLKESADSNQSQPLKVTLRLQYTHNFTDVSGRAMEMIKTLMKPVKVIIMDVSTLEYTCIYIYVY